MSDLNFGDGPSTPSGDLAPIGFAKLQLRIAALEARAGAPQHLATVPNAKAVEGTRINACDVWANRSGFADLFRDLEQRLTALGA